MKHKSQLLWILAPVLIIAVVFLVTLGSLLPQRNQVAMEHTVLYGNPAAAEGLEAVYRTAFQNQLFWETTIRPGASPEVETSYDFSTRKQESSHAQECGFHMSSTSSYDVSYLESVGVSSQPLEDAIADLEAETGIGETKSRKYPLWQFFDNYLIEYYIYFPYTQNRSLLADIDETVFSDFFRIPVLPEEQIVITCDKTDYPSEVLSTEVDGGFPARTCSAFTDDAVYFSFDSVTGDGRYVDTSLIPGGYGIYRLPYTKETFSGSSPSYTVHSEELSNCFSLDPTVRVCDLRLDSRQETLFLYTQENDENWLTLLRTDTMEILQRLCLSGSEMDASPWYQADDFFVLSDGYTLLVFAENEAGCFEKQLETSLSPSEEPLFHLSSNATMAWDGRQLAITSYSPKEEDEWVTTAFVLAVYDDSGLRYAGRYDPVLNPTGRPEDFNYICQSPDNALPEIHWEVKPKR